MALEQEIATFKEVLPTLLGDQGKYALVQGERLVGVYETYKDALTVGYDKFGLTPFLVKKILANEEIQFFSRDIVSPCHT